MKKLLLTLLLMLIIPSAHAACLLLSFNNPTTTLSPTSNGGKYNVFDPTEYVQTVTFTVQALVNVGTCTYYITLDPGQGTVNQRLMSQGGTTLKYNVYTDITKAHILKSNSTATAAETITGTFGTNIGVTQSTNVTLAWVIPAQTVVPAAAGALYSDTGLNLSLYAGTCCGSILPAVANLTFQTQVETSAAVSVVSSGSAFNAASNGYTLGFGNLVSNAQLGCDISIQSNSGYTLKLSSANGQKLVQTPAVSSTIPYTATLSGGSINLGGGQITAATQPATVTTPVGGTNLPLNIKIGTLTGTEISGNYRDDINLSLSAN